MPNQTPRRRYRDNLTGQQPDYQQDHDKQHTSNLTFIMQIAAVLAGIVLTLAWMGEEQLADQIKSEAVISNAVHVAKLDAAERRREAIALAALGNADDTGADQP